MSYKESTEQDNNMKELFHPIFTAMDSNAEDTKKDETESNSSLGNNDSTTNNDKQSSPRNPFGRRGDPRMNRAVIFQIEREQMSPLNALLAGGFEFPDGPEGVRKNDRNIYDSENVSLCQRKNQLTRRIRLVKKELTKRLSDTCTSANRFHKKRTNQSDGCAHFLQKEMAPHFIGASISTKKLDESPSDDYSIYNGNSPNPLPPMRGPVKLTPSFSHGIQSELQTVLNQSIKRSSCTDTHLLEAGGVLFEKYRPTNFQYKSVMSSPKQHKWRQEEGRQNINIPNAKQLGWSTSSQYRSNPRQLVLSHDVITAQIQNLQLINQYRRILLQNFVTTQFRNQLPQFMLKNNSIAAYYSIVPKTALISCICKNRMK